MGKPTFVKSEFDIVGPFKNGSKLEFNHNKKENQIEDWYMTVREVQMTSKQLFHVWKGKHDLWDIIQKLGSQNMNYEMGFNSCTQKSNSQQHIS